MGKPKPLPAVAEVPPEALAEDRRRAEAMVALVKEMTKGCLLYTSPSPRDS